MKNKALIIFAIALLVIICIVGVFLFTTGKQENTNEKEDTEQQIVESTLEFEEISTEQSSETQMETITEDTEGTQIIESAEETESESQEITEQAPAPQEDTSVDIETSTENFECPFEWDGGSSDDFEWGGEGEGASGNDSDFRFNSNSADTTETEDNNDSGNNQEGPFEVDEDQCGDLDDIEHIEDGKGAEDSDYDGDFRF